MKFQRTVITSIGSTWVDETDSERFIEIAAKFYGHTVEQIKKGLSDGYEIKTGAAWDATKIRDFNTTKPIRSLTDQEKEILRGDKQPEGVDDSI